MNPFLQRFTLFWLGAVLMTTTAWGAERPSPIAQASRPSARAARPARGPHGILAANAVAPCANPGKDGSPTALTGIVNTYFAGTGTAAAAATSIAVAASGGATTAVAAGDLLLVIQMQGADIDSDNSNAYGSNTATGSGYLTTNFTAGQYEYVVASGPVTNGAIALATGLVNSYSTAAATTTTGRRSFQVVRIPQYNNVTLGGQVNALAWDGNQGGVLVLDVAGTLTLNNQTLNAAGLGFRGGGGKQYNGGTGLNKTDYRTTNGQLANGAKGEGIAGTPRYTLAMQALTTTTTATDNSTNAAAFGATAVADGYPNGDNGRGAPGNAGGGGTDDVPNSGNGSNSNGINVGGAGGGNGGKGGLGGWPRITPGLGGTIDTVNHAIGGVVFTQATTSRLVMGGGGGAGSNNNGDGGQQTNGTGAYSSGAAGGGLILVRTGSVSGTGTANASGAAGIFLDASGTGSNDGAGGGGGGGTVLFTANTTGGLANLTILASGGVGGSNKDANDVAHGPGGGGGGGIVFTNGSISAASSVVGGKPGTTATNDSYNGTFYGAKQGAAGSLTTNNSTSINNSIAGADCLTADVVTTLSTTQTSVAAGASITYTAKVQNNGPGNSSGVIPQVQLPAGLTTAAFTSLPTGASYSNSTGLLTLPTTTSLAYGAANALTYSFTFTAPNYTTTINGVASSTATTTDPTATNNNGSAANAQVQTVVTLPNNNCAGTAYPNAGGSGLYAEYYAGYFNDDLTFFTKNAPGLTRTDGTINFANDNSWGNIVPPASGNDDMPTQFSSRYRGSITIAAAGSYTFYLTSDDASYLWIDAGTGNPTTGNAAISNGGTHGSTAKQVTLTLTAGPHNLLIYYGQSPGDSDLILQYSGGPNNLAQQVVPNSLLCPTDVVDLATTITGPGTAVVGQTVYYQATTTNSGAGNATDATTTITLPNAPAASTLTLPANATYNASTGVVMFTNGTLAANTSVVNTVAFVAQASPTTVTGQAASTTSNADANANNNNGSAANANVSTVVSPTGASGTPAPCATAGKDGAVPALASNPNTYYPSTASQTLAVGAKSINVGASTGAATPIAAGDLLLVIQMQGADINATNTDSYGDGVAGGSANGSSVTTNFTAGQYEYVVASGPVTGGAVALATGLVNSYVNAPATATTGQRTFQVIRVPQYTNLTLAANTTITPTPWNGSTGGLIALDVDGIFNLNGSTIDVSGAGFRGGAGRKLTGAGNGTTYAGTDYRTPASININGQKGEGTAGTPQYVNNNGTLLNTTVDGYPNGSNGRGAPGTAGGGGTDTDPVGNSQNDGGGGGANGGRGGRGGNAWSSGAASGGEPGAAFPAASSSRLVLGGGGGAGTNNDGTGNAAADGFASSGAAGGGLVLVRTGSVSGTGKILANGANASNTVLNDGSGGGGAGGSILVTATNSTTGLANLTLNANGGTGGTNTPGGAAHGPGGGGGGGVILANGAVAASTTTPGANGTTQGGVAYGSETGTVGVGNTAISNNVANSVAGANCIADVATTITGPTTAGSGQATGTFTATYTNQGAVTASNVTQTVVLPAGANLTAAQRQDLITRYGLTASSFSTAGSGTSAVTTINFGTATLATGASNSFTFAYNAPATTGNVATASNVTTLTSEGGLTANNMASVITNLTPVADVTVALTGPTTVSSGQPTGTFTTTFTDEGPQAANNVMQTVVLPTGASLTAAQQQDLITRYGLTASSFSTNGSGTAAVTTINFGTAGTLASGASNVFTFAFTAPTTTGISTLTGNVSVPPGTEGANAAPNTSNLPLNTVPVTDVSAAIVAAVSPVTPGQTATFNATFANSSNQDAAGVARTVQLPTGLTNVTASNGGTYSSTTGLITYPAITLASGTNSTSAITFTMPASGTVTGTANVSTTTAESNSTNNVASASIAAGPQFDLATTLSGPTTSVAGSPVTLNVTTTNNAGSQAVAGATETVQLVSGLTNVYVSGGGYYNASTNAVKGDFVNGNFVTSANGGTTVAAGAVAFPPVGNLPAGQTVANTITYNAPTTAFAPSAVVTPNTTAAGETNTANNTAYLNGATTSTNLTVTPATTATANVYAILSTTSTIVAAGTQVTYTAGVGNDGPTTASNVTEQLQLVPNLTTTSLMVAGQTGTLTGTTITFSNTGATYSTTTGLLTYTTIATLPSGTSQTVPVVVTVPATVGNNGQLLASLSVGSATSDNVPSDNVKAVAVTVMPTADLATTLTGPASATPGQQVSYAATFTNNGPDPAAATTETVQLPTGLSGVTVLDGQGNAVTGASYNATTGLVTLPAIASDAVGATQTFTIGFVAPTQGYTVSSAVGSSTTDSAPANNSASATTAITPVADVAVAIAGPATTVAGNPVTYTVTTANNGPSPAAGVVATLQLPAGLSNVTVSSGSYNSTSGLVTFASTSLAVGGSALNYASFTMPTSPPNGQISGVASVTSTTADNVASNNTAGLTTDVAPVTTTVADLSATITAPASPVTAGSTVSYTLAYANAGPDAAANVAPVASLPPGLLVGSLTVAGQQGTQAGSVITFPNGTTYNTTTGTLTFPVIASQASGNTTSYAVTFPAPGSGSLQVNSAVSSATTDNGPNANQASSTITVTAAYDATTSISGPATALPGAVSVYEVTTTNNGPSVDPSTTQMVTLPNKPAASAVTNISNNGTYDASTGIIIFSVPNLGVGAANAVTNTFEVAMPATGSQMLNAAVTSAGESSTTNNTATVTTAPTNYPPVAQNIVNSLQSNRGNTAQALPISSLNATDPDGTVGSYTIASLPTSSQGTLYYNGSAAAVGTTVTDASKLSFVPASGFVGNAFFTYTATDNKGAVSNTALYTIPVAQDQNTVYTATPAKGGANKYVNNDVLATTIDPNTAVYNNAGLVYNATGVLQSNTGNLTVTNGVGSAVLDSNGNGPASNPTNALPSGVSLDPITGQIKVDNTKGALPKITTATTYSVYVITTDLNGGTNRVLATFTLGAYPLPVELVAFTAQAVQNRDTQLGWTTATELNNDHFDVERSLDGTTFTKVGAVAGQGTKATATTYAFTDAGIGPKVAAGLPVYYRLRQVDASGSSSYSPVRTVTFGPAAAAAVLTLYPNPAVSTTALDLSALPATATYQVVLLDAVGRQVRQATLSGGLAQTLNVADLASGTYQVVVSGTQADGSALRKVLRLTKE